jgi:hypothetical protein
MTGPATDFGNGTAEWHLRMVVPVDDNRSLNGMSFRHAISGQLGEGTFNSRTAGHFPFLKSVCKFVDVWRYFLWRKPR